MPKVDDFLQFIAEELAKEGPYGVVIDAPYDNEKLWLVGTKSAKNGSEGFVYAQDLIAAANKMSQAWDFTHKDLKMREDVHFSKVYHAALLAAHVNSSLLLWAPEIKGEWVLELEDLGKKFTGVLMETVLMDAYDYLFDISI